MTTETESILHKPDNLLYSCSACSKWVPVTVASTVKSEQGVKYFCGKECQEKWVAQQPNS